MQKESIDMELAGKARVVDPLPDVLSGRGSPTSDSLAWRHPDPDLSFDPPKIVCNPVQTSVELNVFQRLT